MAYRFMDSCGAVIVLGLLIGGCASDEMTGPSGTGAASSAGAASISTRNIERIAPGAAEDTLNACLARIPQNATAGQRLLAEESCRRDQAARR